MPPKKQDVTEAPEKEYTTITLPRQEYERLSRFKEDLEHRPDYSWVAGLGLGAFIGFITGLAASATRRSIFTCGTCGTQTDLTNWGEPTFACPRCGTVYIKGTP